MGREISLVSHRRECDVAFDSAHTVAVYRIAGLGHVLVSHQSKLPGVGPECMAFRCDESGDVVDWRELASNRIGSADVAIAQCLADVVDAAEGRAER